MAPNTLGILPNSPPCLSELRGLLLSTLYLMGRYCKDVIAMKALSLSDYGVILFLHFDAIPTGLIGITFIVLILCAVASGAQIVDNRIPFDRAYTVGILS